MARLASRWNQIGVTQARQNSLESCASVEVGEGFTALLFEKAPIVVETDFNTRRFDFERGAESGSSLGTPARCL